MSLHPSLAAVRRAVRTDLADLGPGARVLVACSGGADSLALLSACVHGAREAGWYVVGVTVDHGLQEGSEQHATHVVHQMAGLGVAETAKARVVVEGDGRGMEDAARRARYAVLDELADRFDTVATLLGHTRDDQAETVLMGLAQGSGGRSLAGMRRRFGPVGSGGVMRYRRPLLDVSRDDTQTACQVEGTTWWTDPANLDPGYTRVRVRRTVLPLLEEHLGPGVAAALARTADQVRADVEALDDLAGELLQRAGRPASGGVPDHLDLTVLLPQPAALVTRVLRAAAVGAGAADRELFHVHVIALHDLATGRLRGEVQLPGHVTAYLLGTGAGDGGLGFRRTAPPRSPRPAVEG